MQQYVALSVGYNSLTTGKGHSIESQYTLILAIGHDVAR